LREIRAVVIIETVPHAPGIGAISFGCESRHNQREANRPRGLRIAGFETWPGSSGVERSPEKAGVGGSIPSLATTFQSLTSLKTTITFQKRSNKLGGSPGFVSKFFARGSGKVSMKSYAPLCVGDGSDGSDPICLPEERRREQHGKQGRTTP
jgi:hypothetical protein